MATASPSAEEIQREMREVRAELRGGMQEIVNQASGLGDWQQYVKAYPWLSLGAAAALGYFLVPSRPVIIRPDAKELMELAKSNRLELEPIAQRKPSRPGLVGTVMNYATSALVQAGMAFATQQLAQLQQSLTAPRSQDGRWRQP
jgi:hypothetical protein